MRLPLRLFISVWLWAGLPAAAMSDDVAPGGNVAAGGRAADELRKKLGSEFLVRRVGCFLLAGNITQRQMDRIADGTVRSVSAALSKDFFDKKPTHVTTVYLFKDDETYRRYAWKLFHERVASKYGYYIQTQDRMMMNIATGTGTLAHEMFHALVAADFPEIPTWLNEGIASLCEQSQIVGGSIYGLINWRYPILMKALKEGKAPRLKQLVATSDASFRGDGRDANYAAARYFCMYLQEKKLLRKFYKKFRDHAKEDLTGAKFLVELLGKDLDEVETEWRAWVKTLRR